MRKLRVMLAAALLAAPAFAVEMGRDASAYPHVQNAFIEMGAVTRPCGEATLQGAESACGFVELDASLTRGWLDLVFLPGGAVSAWERLGNDYYFRKGYVLDGRALEVLILQTPGENRTDLYFHHYLR